MLVAEYRSAVAGLCTVQTLISTAEGGFVGLIEDMVVAAALRRKGIGRGLLRAAEAWARREGLTRLQLLAEAENRAALDFYRAAGWHGTGLVCLRKQRRLTP